MADNDMLILSFCEITGADPQTARHFLEAADWNFQTATEQYFENDDDIGHGTAGQDEEDDSGIHAPPPVLPSGSTGGGASAASSSSAPKSKPQARAGGGTAKIRTLADMGGDDEEGDGDEEKQDLFAGGEKSGLAVQNPGDTRGGGRNLIQDILKRAAEGGQRRREAEESTPETRFSGSGYTLGSDTTESVAIPDPNTASAPTRPSVTRTLTFWRDGFSVEDGPLMRYDDPANREILQAIENGRAPLSLMNVEPGQPADVNVFKRLDEDYVPPKKKFVPFAGQGQRLGAPAPGEVTSPPTTAHVSASSSSSSPPAPSINVDASAPTTSLQIRLGDGTRLVSRFNHTHTIGDIYGFVNASSVESRTRNYVLQTTFPNKELSDMSQTVKDAGLINAVVIQKWA